jgi:monoterpene epsilon-lactone hydrolase
MASWQAHLAVWIVKWRVKRKLRGVRDYRVARKILRPDPYTVPASIRISPAQVGGVPGEWVGGNGAAKTVLLYLHGGGYFGCSAQSHRPITVGFALEGFRVLAPDYRLAPENQFPAAVEDAVAAYRGLLGEGYSAERIVIGGDSAGGGLALALLLAAREGAIPFPAGACLFFAVDGSRRHWRIHSHERSSLRHVQWTGHRPECALLFGRHRSAQPASLSALCRPHRSSSTSYSRWRG